MPQVAEKEIEGFNRKHGLSSANMPRIIAFGVSSGIKTYSHTFPFTRGPDQLISYRALGPLCVCVCLIKADHVVYTALLGGLQGVVTWV